jgi:hypothetical protein
VRAHHTGSRRLVSPFTSRASIGIAREVRNRALDTRERQGIMHASTGLRVHVMQRFAFDNPFDSTIAMAEPSSRAGLAVAPPC